MGSFDTAVLEGGDELLRRLQTLEPRIARKHLGASLKAGAKPIHAAVVANLPTQAEPQRGQGAGPGHLKAKIRIRAGKRRRGGATIVVQTAPRSQLGIPDDAEHFYPAALEYGHDGVPPDASFRRAYDSKRGEATRLIGDDLGRRITEEARKKV